MPAPASRLYDVLALTAEAVDELVVGGIRDTHHAVADRVHGLLRRPTGGLSDVPGLAHRAISASVYAGVGGGLRAAGKGFGWAGGRGLGPLWETGPRSRFVSSALNGLIGDRLAEQRPGLGLPIALRVGGQDVTPDRGALAAAYPTAQPRLVVFVHGLSESEAVWDLRRARLETSYPEIVEESGWTAARVRLNTGLAVRANGVDLAALLQQVVDEWPVEVERIALVGHSMGGLILRAAGAVRSDHADPWTDRVSDVITLGTPHEGAPLARLVGDGSSRLSALPETAAIGRFLEWRSVGVRDLVEGLGEDVPPLPHARHRLVSGSVTRHPGHPLGRLVGDLLVRPASAQGRDGTRELFPGAEILHLPGAGHFDLLNHPEVHAALRRWLA